MGRKNIFDVAEEKAEATKAFSPSLPQPTAATSIGSLRDSLRDITANSIRDIDPSQIDPDGVRDRLESDQGIDELANSIREHGQQVPILVRPLGHDRYRIVYGRRRLAAIRLIGGPVKAIVRTLDDVAATLAQGHENNLRLDPSFIEKSIFARDLRLAGYDTSIIQDALGINRHGVSRHAVVADRIPDAVIMMIGAAHGIGRRPWTELADLSRLDHIDLPTIAKIALANSDQLKSDERFTACLSAARIAATRQLPEAKPEKVNQQGGSRGNQTSITLPSGLKIGAVKRGANRLSFNFSLKEAPEFGLWLEQHAERVTHELHALWQKEFSRESSKNDHDEVLDEE
ncbi:MAG: ParB family chromosome partitioning protein [Paracoccaceae bacterium]|jgi:ParB family chromosome partitioning protein